jgi:hypothetical protein
MILEMKDDREFSLRSLTSQEIPFPEVLRCSTTRQADLTTQHAAITAKKITTKACGSKSTFLGILTDW